MFAFGVDKKTQPKPTKPIPRSGCMLLPTLKTCKKYIADLKNINLKKYGPKNMLFQAFISCYVYVIGTQRHSFQKVLMQSYRRTVITQKKFKK